MRFSSLALALLLPVVASAETIFDITLHPFGVVGDPANPSVPPTYVYESGFAPKHHSLAQPGDFLNFTLGMAVGNDKLNVYESTFEQPCVQNPYGFSTDLAYGVPTFVKVQYTPMYFYSGDYATCRDGLLVYAAGASDEVFSQFLRNLVSSPPPTPSPTP